MQEDDVGGVSWVERIRLLPHLFGMWPGEQGTSADDCLASSRAAVSVFSTNALQPQTISNSDNAVPSLQNLRKSFESLSREVERLPERKRLLREETLQDSSKELPLISDFSLKRVLVAPQEENRVAEQEGKNPQTVMSPGVFSRKVGVFSPRPVSPNTCGSQVFFTSPVFCGGRNTQAFSPRPVSHNTRGFQAFSPRPVSHNTRGFQAFSPRPVSRSASGFRALLVQTAGVQSLPRTAEEELGSVLKTPKFSLLQARKRTGRIRVVVRKRPIVSGDLWSDCVAINPPNVHVAVKKVRFDLTDYEDVNDFTFDDSFSEDKKNVHIFDSCGKELISTTLDGGSASIFAYGQTGSGKTHTMLGSGEEKGLYILAATELFSRLQSECEVSAALYEIYCNSLFDLLNNRTPIVVREDHNRRVNLCGLSWNKVDSADALWRLINSGAEQRSTGSTTANERSSRSHAVLTIRLCRSDDPSFCGTLNFVDLAGSERAADTAMSDKQTRQEGAEINKSLLALKECIRALDEKKKHVPFRGSKLTEILRDSFVGNSRTVMIANISASSCNYEHTLNTLRYAFRVKGLSIESLEHCRVRNASRSLRQSTAELPRQQNSSGAQGAAVQNQRARTPFTIKNLSRATVLQREKLSNAYPKSVRVECFRPFANNTSRIGGADTSNGNDILFGNDDVFLRYFREQTREKLLNVLSSRNLSRGPCEDVCTGASCSAEVVDSAICLEEQQKLSLLLEYVAKQMQQEMRQEVAKAVRSRDIIIRKLRNEKSALQASIMTLKKTAEECQICRNKMGEVKEMEIS